MDKLKELLGLCKASVTIQVNYHRDYYQGVKEYIEEQQLDAITINEIGKDIYAKMIETNTIIEIQAYPNTPIGSYTIYHYDIDEAINEMLTCIKTN